MERYRVERYGREWLWEIESGCGRQRVVMGDREWLWEIESGYGR